MRNDLLPELLHRGRRDHLLPLVRDLAGALGRELASISTVREKTNIAGLGRRNHAKPRRSDFPPNQGIGVG